jgi:hypothetical protein
VGAALRRRYPRMAEHLSALAGQELVKVDELLARGLVLNFGNNTELVVPLESDGTDDGPEAAEYSSGTFWDAGEPPFD